LLGRLVDAYPDQVQIAYRHFPLNEIHPNAQKSAEASEAAGAQGAFWEYHDALYEKQGEWSSLDQDGARDWFIDLAGDLDLDKDRFASDLDNGVFAEYVSSMEEEAINIGLPGTPSALVNGELIAGQGLPIDFAVWDNFIGSTIAVESLAEMQYDAAPPMTLEDGKTYMARVTMESGDEFLIELNQDAAPLAVNSFVFLANEGWYDGVTFHRVLPGFMAQTGDPTGTGMGGPGYEFVNEIDPSLSHDAKGVVAMANSGPDTNGSQFFITLAPATHLDGGYTIFGRVVEGMDVVEGVTLRDPAVDPQAPPGDMIQSVSIEVVE
jgi:cyclophilin family peptidyl-prolyl cis-trans isomerase